ncbi:excinuclease ABC subunit UvrC [Micrococcoides hystricis]|uniref:UvrABC system protein C n=1 Tax=Micrococcoides hystricis TaxID=1572761 RepID=A0ABV6P733_9MICC
MADPASYRPAPGTIPTEPGVYRFRDAHDRVIYVGKAKSLRSRLNSYFTNPALLPPKTHAMVHTAARVEWTIVGSELEALQLEYTWIKEFTPRFNIMYRDDKSYPYLAVTMNEAFPRVQVMRGDRRKGVKYFGPFSPVKAIRETVDTMLRVFPVRTCSAGVFRRAERAGRPCLLGYIDKCSAPCVGNISQEDHYALAEDFVAFMSGDARRFVRQLETQMKDAVAELDYESAARYRDDIQALHKVFERNTVVLSEDTEADIFGLVEDELEAAVQVFHVRGGRIRGQRGWVVEKVDDTTEGQLVEQLLQQVYGGLDDTSRIPREVLIPFAPTNPKDISTWLTGLRGANVSVRVPQRGDKKALLETVVENAEAALKLHKVKRSGDITNRSLAIQELQEALGMEEPPLRIECFDISHVQGTNVVASMVVFEDGLPKKRDYRKFNISEEGSRDDTASMFEVITRRFANYLRQRAKTAHPVLEHADEQAADATDETLGQHEAELEEKNDKFAYPPSLVVVDGGQAQVSAANRALEELGLDAEITVVGLAKRLEEIWLPEDPFPVILPRSSEGLYLLQRVRDEAHRFAITAHRSKRSKAMIGSELDLIPGLGATKQKALRAHFKSMKRIRAASVSELQEAPGIGPKLAQTIHDHFASAEKTVAVNMTTGEVQEES